MSSMPPVDLSEGNIRCAIVLVKQLYKAAGYQPIGIQLAITPETENEVWYREGKKLLLENYRRRQRGLKQITPETVHKRQDVPVEWDELAGEKPGEDEMPITKHGFFLSGPVREFYK